MAFSIATNTQSLFAQRQLEKNTSPLAKSLQRLSSGLRINSAADDAAGLRIANRLSSQTRGLTVANRNVSDAVSMVQVAEGAVVQISENMQRIRELAIQSSNGSNGPSERRAMQAEASQLLQEIDRIAETTTFGGKKLLDGGAVSAPNLKDDEILIGLHSYWLSEAQERISTYFGLDAPEGGPDLDIQIVDGTAGGLVAAVGYAYSGSTLVSQTLLIERADYSSENTGYDRIIAHEMAHAIMGRTMNLLNLETWFIEGTAEFIAGADERLQSSVGVLGVNGLTDLIDQAWPGINDPNVSHFYSAGYAAVRFMHDAIKNAGGNGITEVFDHLEEGDTLEQALIDVNNDHTSLGWTSLNDFYDAFEDPLVGGAFVNEIVNNDDPDDVGAIGGLDADDGPLLNSENVISDVDQYKTQPLTNINSVFPDQEIKPGSYQVEFQVGAEANQTIDATFTATGTVALGISTIDLSTVAGSQYAIDKIDKALTSILSTRAGWGATMNRLDSTTSNLGNIIENVSASTSRIVDADYAQETANLVKRQIIQQAATSVLVQANSSQREVLNLLEGLG